MHTLSESQELEVIALLKEYIPDANSETLTRKLSDLGVDSMDFITLIFDVEDKYSLTIDANEIDMSETLSQFLTGLLKSET